MNIQSGVITDSAGSPDGLAIPTGRARRRALESTRWFRKSEYGFRSHYYRTSSGHAMHYLDEGSSDRVVVLVHGTPGWSFEFRHLVRTLAADGYRVIAPDHIGFGLSDRPDDWSYTPAAHAQNLKSLLAGLDVAADRELNFRFVLHDFGGQIGLAAINELFAGRQDAVRAVSVMNSWCRPFAESNAEFHRQLPFLRSALLRWLYARMNFSAYVLVRAAWGAGGIDRNTHLHFRRLHRNSRDRRGTLGFLCATYDAEANEFLKATLRASVERLKKVPLQLIWGMADSLVGPEHMDDWAGFFSIAERDELPDAGHFPHEESPPRVLESLRRFLAEIDAQ